MLKPEHRVTNVSMSIKSPEIESTFTKLLREHPIVAYFAPIVLSLILQFTWIYYINSLQVPAEIKMINEKLDTLSTKVSGLSSTVNSLQTDVKDLEIYVTRLDARVEGIDKRCDDLCTFLNYGERLTPTTIAENAVSTWIRYYDDTQDSGNFVDGKFHDNTGNAWYITRDDISGTDYMYYRGEFYCGGPDKSSKYEFKSNLTNSDIELYIEGKQFDSELKWAETDSMKNS